MRPSVLPSGAAASSATAASPSSIRSYSTTATQKMISSTQGFVIVESM